MVADLDTNLFSAECNFNPENMKRRIVRLAIFLVLNFGALGIGGIFTQTGVSSEWYQDLDKAPWTPPGWVFGAAWTSIMICFSFYMTYAWERISNRKLLIGLFIAQWALNVLWNPVFFRFHEVFLGLMVITLLTLLIGYILFSQISRLRLKSLLLLPYFLWLIIALSLNGFVYLNMS
jgi:tryptophan-rich sensory protein